MDFLERLLLPYRWKKRAKARKHIRYRASDVGAALTILSDHDVPSAILRPESTLDIGCVTPAEGDIDLLVDVSSYRELLPLASQYNSAGISFDIYGARGGRGLTYNAFPYYPPALAREILGARVCKEGLWRPTPRHEFLSFLYHLIYHKGPRSGLPLADAESEAAVAEDYSVRLLALAAAAGVRDAPITTLIAAHQLLAAHDWAMPYDLMIRLQHTNPWIAHLVDVHQEHLRPLALRSDDVIVFMLREDARFCEDHVMSMLAGKFEILRAVELSGPAKLWMARRTRGGNWSHIGTPGETTDIYAYKVVVCRDPAPVRAAPSPELAGRYPLVDNWNALFKVAIREAVESLRGGEAHAVHGSDNAFEAAYLLECLELSLAAG